MSGAYARRATLAAFLPALLFWCGCAREKAPVAQAEPAAQPQPWRWHALGSLVVVEGELAEDTGLVLEGRSIRHERRAELGPLRWELMRPPKGEVAELRDANRRVLARFRFEGGGAPALGAEPAPAPAPKVAIHIPAPPAPKPPPPPAPKPHAAPKETPKSAPPPAPVHTPVPPPTPAPKPHAVRKETPISAPPPITQPLPPPAPKPVPAPAPAPASNPPPAIVVTAAPPPPAPTRRIPEILPPPVRTGPAFPGAGEALNLTHGPRHAKRLLLSFDGGSNAEGAGEILDALKARGVRTTLFLTGTFIQKFPDLVKRMAAEGHELGNHTMRHPHMAAWTKAQVQEELLSADRALVRLLGQPMAPVWRAPYGEHTAQIRRWAEELGYRHIGWSEGADTLDWATPREKKLYRPGDAVLARLYSRLTRGGEGLIVLMHLGSERQEGDRPGGKLGTFLDRALAGGWTFVRASDMLSDMGWPPWNAERRLALLQQNPAGSGGR